jgi:hypothetical protein
MSNFFDPDGQNFVIRMLIIVLIILFFTGLCVNHWKTEKKRTKEQQNQMTVNPSFGTLVK